MNSNSSEEGFISAVVPVYKDTAALTSLLKQLVKFNDLLLEIIVVNGLSHDMAEDPRLPELVKAYPKVRLISVEAQRARQMNAGAKQASGRVLWFVHADSDLSRIGTDRLLEFDRQSNRCWGRFDVSLQPATPLLSVVAWMINWRSGLSSVCTGDQGIFVKSADFREVDGFPEQALMEDIELSKRLKIKSRTFRIKTPLITSSRKWLNEGILKTIGLMWYLRFIYWLGAKPETIHKMYYGRKSNVSTYSSSIKPKPGKKDLAILVFSKPPVLGRVKTRLAKHIGDEYALSVYKALLSSIIYEMAEYQSDAERQVDLYISASDTLDHPFFLQLQRDLLRDYQYELKFHHQSDGDLGCKMYNCLDDKLKHYQQVVIVGGDAVSLTKASLYSWLGPSAQHDIGLLPTEDGGYLAISAKRIHSGMFDEIDWGTAKVFTQQQKRLEQVGLSAYVGERLWDLDEFDDLERALNSETIRKRLEKADLPQSFF